MRIVGANEGSKKAVEAVLKLVHPGLVFKQQGPCDGKSLYGHLAYGYHTAGAGILIKNGTPTSAPCAHVTAQVVKALGSVPGVTRVVADMLLFKPWALNITSKLVKKQQKKGLTCSCYSSAVQGGVSQPQSYPIPAVKKPAAKNLFLHVRGIEADPIADGETETAPSSRRNIVTAISTLYLLAEIDAELAMRPARDTDATDGVREAIFRQEFKQYFSDYAGRFARNLFDYLVMAAAGEARHATAMNLGFAAGPECNELYKESTKRDPRSLIPALVASFERQAWPSSFGGKKWAKIARTAGLFFKPWMRKFPVVYADHCVDLAHNGGMAFDKAVIFEPTGYSERERYTKILDAKRNGQLSQSGLTLTVECEGLLMWERARALGLVPALQAIVKSVADTKVETVKWGTDGTTVAVKAGTIQDTSEIAYSDKSPQELKAQAEKDAAWAAKMKSETLKAMRQVA